MANALIFGIAGAVSLGLSYVYSGRNAAAFNDTRYAIGLLDKDQPLTLRNLAALVSAYFTSKIALDAPQYWVLGGFGGALLGGAVCILLGIQSVALVLGLGMVGFVMSVARFGHDLIQGKRSGENGDVILTYGQHDKNAPIGQLPVPTVMNPKAFGVLDQWIGEKYQIYRDAQKQSVVEK